MAIQGQDTALSGGRGSPNAWSPGSDGQNWAIATGIATLAFSGTRLQLTSANSNTIVFYGTKTVADIEVSHRSTNNAVADFLGVVGRATASNNYYGARYVSGTLFIHKLIAGTSTDLASVAVTESAGGTYWMKIRIQGNTISAKYWVDGSTEPGNWSITANDTSIAASSVGQFGIRCKTGATASFDTFLAQDPPSTRLTAYHLSGKRIGRVQ